MFYRRGFSPLVGWLKPYMIPEVLNIPVSQEYMERKPLWYLSFSDHMNKLQQYSKGKKATNIDEVHINARKRIRDVFNV